MGKHKKKSHKKWLSDSASEDSKQKLKYQTRAEFLLAMIPECIQQMWFGDDEEKRKEYGEWLVRQEQYDSEGYLDDLDDSESIYEKEYRKLYYKPLSLDEIPLRLFDLQHLKKKIKKNKKYNKLRHTQDRSLATYMDTKRYHKKFISNDDYRKALKKVAKEEQYEEKEMRKLGYIKSNDPDEELKKLKKANDRIGKALSDTYTQKHFLE